jgi:hypothetical protein
LQDEADPFAAIRAAWPAWDAGGLPELDEVSLGPRSSHDPRRASTDAFRPGTSEQSYPSASAREAW